jgi:hypothetical protein
MRRNSNRLKRCAILALLTTATIPAAYTQQMGRNDVYRAAQNFELKPLTEKPDWAGSPEQRLFRFAWLSDCHLTQGERYRIFSLACRTLRKTVKPIFVAITGDNCAFQAPPEPGVQPQTPDVLRQIAFKEALEQELALPYAVIPGDNWPWGFSTVFGPFQYSFDVGGLHAVFVAPDASATGVEGCAALDPGTWQWLRADLAANRDRPTLVFLHEPVVPPSTAYSGDLLNLLKEFPSVIGTMAGHIHLDLEFRRRDITHILCPSLGVNPAHGFKVVDVYPDRIVLNTWEYDPQTETYTETLKWQKIDIPKQLRPPLQPVTGESFTFANRNQVPAHPRRKDQSLANRRCDLLAPMLMFLMQIGVQSVLGDDDTPAADKTEVPKH